MASGRVDSFTLLKALQVVIDTTIVGNGTVEIPSEYGYAHCVYIVAYGTWNYQYFAIVAPQNGNTPSITALLTPSGTISVNPISANGDWGLKFTNPSQYAMPLKVFRIVKQ